MNIKNLSNIEELNNHFLNDYRIKKDINLIYYHINRDNEYPFIQIILYNYKCFIPFIGFQEQKFIFPNIFYMSGLEIQNDIINYLKDNLENINCDTSNVKNIDIDGYLLNNNEIYVYIDISCIKIDKLYLTKSSDIWLALSSELINNNHICNIPICKTVSKFVIENIDNFIEIDNIVYPNPEVIYVGNYFKKVEFQSIFGISKSEKKYGNYYYFTFHLEDALKDGSYSKNREPEYRFGKLLTDEINGRYIEGGINRVAILLDKCKYLLEKDVMNLINENLWEDYIIDYDCIYIMLESGKMIILLQDYKRQSSLSYHKIDKRSLNRLKIEIV